MPDFDPTGGAAAPTNAAGSGELPYSTAQDPLVFWDPSKNARIRDVRTVPGMLSTSIPTGPNFGSTDPAFAKQHPGFNFGQYVTNGVSGPTTGNANGMPFASPQGTTLGMAMNNLLDMGASADPASIQTLQEQLVSGGFLDPTRRGFNLGSISGTNDPTYTAWYQLMETSIRTGTDYNAILQARVARDAGKKYEDALALQKAKADKAAKAAAAALLPQTVNRTATQISDPLTAQNLLTTMLTNELGRAPDPAELTQFTQALQTAQAANPTMTTAVTDPGQVQDKSAVQTGGFDPQQFTDNYINQNFSAEKSAVGGATGFYQAALDTLGAGGRGY